MGKDVILTDADSLVHLKFCIDSKLIESPIDFGLVGDVSSYELLNDESLSKYLDKKARESRRVVTLRVLDQLAANQLCIQMDDTKTK